jgi:hypothetical protein
MKFWEELITYFPFIVTSVPDTASRKLLYASVMKSIKQHNLEDYSVGITDGSDL